MDRLMCVQLQSSGPAVELAINGLPVLRLPPGAPPRCLPVHEYLLAGTNRLSLTVGPSPVSLEHLPGQPQLADKGQAAQARLLLLRQGHTPEAQGARELAVLNWAAAEGEAWTAPTQVQQNVELPVAFPRWRWLDAPVMTPSPALTATVLAWLQRLAFELSKGRPEGLLTSSRLRLEELTLAYQWPIGYAADRLKAELQTQFETGALAALQVPKPNDLVLRPVAGSRLLDCLTPLGEPILQLPTAHWPLRVAVVEGNVYVLR